MNHPLYCIGWVKNYFRTVVESCVAFQIIVVVLDSGFGLWFWTVVPEGVGVEAVHTEFWLL